MLGHRDKALTEKKQKEEARVILADLHKSFAAGGTQINLPMVESGLGMSVPEDFPGRRSISTLPTSKGV